MRLIFVHGWSVTDTSTYGRLPEALVAQAGRYGLKLDIQHVWLGRYVSFHDTVSMADVARALDHALRDLTPDQNEIPDFSCITHSTGGPVVREWLERFYGSKNLAASPLRHLVMLAPANHGSALAALGKQRVGRINAWFSGVEPGQRILTWLSLGSQGQIDLARRFIEYKPVKNAFYPFVLTGQSIDKKFYDFINSYLVEAGSDGVVRVAAANLNYSMIHLKEGVKDAPITHGPMKATARLLEVDGEVLRPEPVALGVVPDASHSGIKMGIMGSITDPDSDKPQVEEILQCLCVDSKSDYDKRAKQLAELTAATQTGHCYMMLVFVVHDNQGEPVADFDLFLLGSDDMSPDKLSKGFFVDRQQNASQRNHLVYYVDYDVIIRKKLTGFRVIARPTEGFAYYRTVEYQAGDGLKDVLRPNETLYVDIELRRCIDQNVFSFDPAENPQYDPKGKGIIGFRSETRNSFHDIEPSGKPID
jgi:hypothetical protein